MLSFRALEVSLSLGGTGLFTAVYMLYAAVCMEVPSVSFSPVSMDSSYRIGLL